MVAFSCLITIFSFGVEITLILMTMRARGRGSVLSFFFSSRRRHTRYWRDWSSDVCSSDLAEKAGLTIALLTGREKGTARKAILAGLADGGIKIAVGTHALFQEGVAFHDLGVAVVDEQHRFGVHQRLALGSKGEAVDILVMTATPIPRTLALTYFGDMDVSVLSEKPAGRKPIATKLISIDRLDEVVGGIGRAIANGDQVYWVCPLVGESESIDLAAAEERFEMLKGFFGDQVGLVHGKMAGKDKDAAMER